MTSGDIIINKLHKCIVQQCRRKYSSYTMTLIQNAYAKLGLQNWNKCHVSSFNSIFTFEVSCVTTRHSSNVKIELKPSQQSHIQAAFNFTLTFLF